LTLLVGCQEEHLPHKKLSDEVVGVVICLERGANNLHMVQLMPLPSQSITLASLKPRLAFYFSGATLPRLSWKSGR